MKLSSALLLLLLPVLSWQQDLSDTTVAMDSTPETTVATDISQRTTVAADTKLETTVAADTKLETTVAADTKLETTVAADSKTETSGCGNPSISPDESNSVGAKEARPHSWPWMVSLQLLNSHQCGGSIFNKNWIVTAAHCVEDSLTPSMWTVDAGRHCRDCDEETLQTRFVTKIVTFPGYNNTVYYENDLAMLRVNRPFEFDSHVSPICLPNEPVSESASCIGTGWDITSASTEENNRANNQRNLAQVTVPIVPKAICTDFLHYDSDVTDNMLCAGYEESSSERCQGDAGGPLMCKSNDLWYLHGIMSWGDGCINVQKPGVYTRVHLFVNWIRQTGSV